MNRILFPKPFSHEKAQKAQKENTAPAAVSFCVFCASLWLKNKLTFA